RVRVGMVSSEGMAHLMRNRGRERDEGSAHAIPKRGITPDNASGNTARGRRKAAIDKVAGAAPQVFQLVEQVVEAACAPAAGSARHGLAEVDRGKSRLENVTPGVNLNQEGRHRCGNLRLGGSGGGKVRQVHAHQEEVQRNDWDEYQRPCEYRTLRSRCSLIPRLATDRDRSDRPGRGNQEVQRVVRRCLIDLNSRLRRNGLAWIDRIEYDRAAGGFHRKLGGQIRDRWKSCG